jgi:hypothetical protein
MRVLLFSHTTGYQLRSFNDAAEDLGIDLVFATDRCHQLDDPWQDRAIPVRFHDPASVVRTMVDFAQETGVNGVIAVGDRPVVTAACVAEALGIPWHLVSGASASSDKRRSRAILSGAGLPSPRFEVVALSSAMDPSGVGASLEALKGEFPCVLKPVGLSGSRGVIRANSRDQLAAAIWRIRALLARPEIRAARAGLEDEILVESYIDGPEFALEGVLIDGRLTTFAIFDKPDPLDGPFFEETIYVTPSRLDPAMQTLVSSSIERAALALGLRHGPVHGECRIAGGEVYVLEVAARPIGGLCSQVLKFQASDGQPPGEASLERVLLEHALGRSIDRWMREDRAAAVMMIPIPRRGLLKRVNGEDAARRIPGVTSVLITAKSDQLLELLPEAGSYLGFIFGSGRTPAQAERAVRDAHAALSFEIDAEIPVRAAGHAPA